MPELSPEQRAHAAKVSQRWIGWREKIDIADYERRFVDMEANGTASHGEADFIAALQPTSVLDAGCGTGRVAIELARRGVPVVGADLDADMIAAAQRKAPSIAWHVADLARMQLIERFHLVAMPGNVMLFCEPDDRALIVANLANHLQQDGLLVAGFSLEPRGYSIAGWDRDCSAAGLELQQRYATWEREPWQPSGTYHVSVHRMVS